MQVDRAGNLPKRMPAERKTSNWWQCGMEDLGDYTQANCRQLMVPDVDDELSKRWIQTRYEKSQNLIFWGFKMDKKEVEFVELGRFVLDGSH